MRTSLRRMAAMATGKPPATPSVFGPVPDQIEKQIDASLLKYGTLTSGGVEKPRKSDDLVLLHADFCPFANRALLALLEKEPDPTHPRLSLQLEVCYWMAERDPATEILYGLGLKTVPAAIYNGQLFTESQSVADFIDDLFSEAKGFEPLKPKEPVMLFNMNRFLEAHRDFPGQFYSFLRAQDDDLLREEKKVRFMGELAKFNESCGKISGPFLCGEQFTLADIQMFGFIERTLLVLAHYKKFNVCPRAFSNIHEWWGNVLERPSVKSLRGPRSLLSQAVHAFEEMEREPYLIEVYGTYANDDLPLCRQKMQEAGKPLFNAYMRFKRGQL